MVLGRQSHGWSGRRGGAVLPHQLQAMYFREDRPRLVINEGVGGENAKKIGQRFYDTPGASYRDATHVLWMGRNDGAHPELVVPFVANIVHWLTEGPYFTHGRVAILNIINGSAEGRGTPAYDGIIRVNEALAQRFGDRVLDIRSAMVRLTGGVNDALAEDATADGLHLVGPTYGIVAAEVKTFLDARGW
jgi:hypothetical protein